VDGTESEYWDTFRAWRVHELEGEGDEQPNPAALEKYWDEYLEFNATMLQQSPTEVGAAETEWFRTRWSDVVAGFDYDIGGIWLDGTPEDRAVFSLSNPDVVEHSSRTTAYEEQVCNT